MTEKYLMIAFVIGFWLFVPIGLQFMGSPNYQVIDKSKFESVEKPTLLNYLSVVWNFVSILGTFLIIGIPQAPLLINSVLFMFKVISLIIIIFLIRGDS